MMLLTEQINKMHSLLDEINNAFNTNMNDIDYRLSELEKQSRQQKEKNNKIACLFEGISNELRKENNDIF